jgi:hypothetical protein
MKSTTISRRKTLISIAAAAIGFLFVVIAAYPGFMSPDSLDQYHQAQKGIYSDWHPPMMAWIWHWLLRLQDGPLPMLLLINLLYWSGVGIILRRLRSLWISILFFLLSCTPPMINFLSIIWKDSLLFGLLVFMAALLFAGKDKTMRPLLRVLQFAGIATLSVVALMLRYNAFAALIPLLIYSMGLLNQKWPFRVLLLSGVAVSGLLYFIGSKATDQLCRGQHQHPEQQLMLYDILGISHFTKQNLFPEPFHESLPIDTIHRKYSPCDGGMSIVFGMHLLAQNDHEREVLNSAWQRALVQHPSAAIRHKYASFMCLSTEPLPLVYRYIDPKLGNQSEANSMRKLYIVYNEQALSHRFYVPLYYLLSCGVLSIVAFLVQRRNPKRQSALSLAISLSGFCYGAAYFLLSPCNELRYYYWTIGAAVLALVFLMDALAEKRK